MKILHATTTESNIKYLRANCGVRYWEDATVNGVEDTENGDNMPGKEGRCWCPLIDLETGRITNWEKGKTANIHYKVCDDGIYQLLDENKHIVIEIDDYVPRIMCPKENGFGDYVIMDIDKDGYIKDWKVTLKDFNVTIVKENEAVHA